MHKKSTSNIGKIKKTDRKAIEQTTIENRTKPSHIAIAIATQINQDAFHQRLFPRNAFELPAKIR